jgi:hypothetical protein
MINEIRWIAVDRKALPGLVAEGVIPDKVEEVQHPLTLAAEVFVGCVHSEGRSIPALAVLNSNTSREVLAWLATYSAASFPISQSFRTISSNDLGEEDTTSAGAVAYSSLGYWPSIVLGELLGQGEYTTDLEGVALSRANACYTFARAKAHSIYHGSSKWSVACVERLRALEADGLFVRRSISVDDLRPIWDWATIESTTDSALKDVVEAISYVIDGESSSSPKIGTPSLRLTGLNPTLLGVGPMEGRVREFESFLASMRGAVDDTNARTAAMLVAAAATLVGNGTSHISLLEEFGKRLPTVFAWFGLFAAVIGPKCWDPAWNRATNSVARLLRSRFDLTDPPTFDLSWVEYDFVRAVAKPRDFVSHIPKLYPRLLSIEVIPGVACQFRIGGDVQSTAPQNTPRKESGREHVVPHQGALHQATLNLLEVEHMLANARAMVQKSINQIGTPSQPGLFDPPKRATRKSKQSKLD